MRATFTIVAQTPKFCLPEIWEFTLRNSVLVFVSCDISTLFEAFLGDN